MIEQVGNALPFTAFYSSLGLGTTGLTVTVDVFKNGVIIVTAAACVEAGDGLYTYSLAAGSNDVEGVYIAVFKTATGTVDQQHLVGAWYVGQAGVEKLDAAVSSRNAVAPDNASITLILAKTDNLPGDPADQSAVEAAIVSAVSTIRGADDDTLKSLSDQVDGVQTLGPGSIAWDITVSVDGAPIDGVDVWITTDEAGTNIIARGTTDDTGTVTLLLDAGDYYAWKQLSGYSFTNPEGFTVS